MPHGNGPFKHLSASAVAGDHLTAHKRTVADSQRAFRGVNPERTRAGNAGASHAACNHGRVTRHAAARGENAFGGVHALNVFGARLQAHENHVMSLARELLRFAGSEGDFSCCRARRGGKTGRNAGGRDACVERGMQQLIERQRIDP